MVNYSLAKKIAQMLSMYAVPFIGEANRVRLIQLSRDLTVQVSMKNDTAIEQLLKEIKSAIKSIVKSSLVDDDYFDSVNDSITKCRKVVSVSLKADKLASEDANKEKISRYINAICEFSIDMPKFSIMSNSIRQIGERYKQALTVANSKPQIQRALHGMTESIKRIIDPVIQELKKMITGERMQGKFFKKKLMKIVAMIGNVVRRSDSMHHINSISSFRDVYFSSLQKRLKEFDGHSLGNYDPRFLKLQERVKALKREFFGQNAFKNITDYIAHLRSLGRNKDAMLLQADAWGQIMPSNTRLLGLINDSDSSCYLTMRKVHDSNIALLSKIKSFLSSCGKFMANNYVKVLIVSAIGLAGSLILWEINQKKTEKNVADLRNSTPTPGAGTISQMNMAEAKQYYNAIERNKSRAMEAMRVQSEKAAKDVEKAVNTVESIYNMTTQRFKQNLGNQDYVWDV